ncbi:MAG: hypothetical protein MUE81_03580, partial [Thermoflexibacter sp.]|nr:hypothetical protein [Thermoflexibacter sp.]
GVLGIIGYLGWGQYQKSIEEERLFRLRLQADEQRHEKEMIEAQRKAEEEKKAAEEQKKLEHLQKIEAENQEIRQIISQKKSDALAQVKGLIESKGNGIIERQESEQVWSRKITEVALEIQDSICTYSYRTGTNGEITVEISFALSHLGNLKYIVEKTNKTNYDFLEINSKYEQKIFSYCEKSQGRDNCDKNKEISSFKIFMGDKKSSQGLLKNMELLKKLYGADFETLKKWYKANDL